MRIGIFGGSFDPIHTAHLILAETLLSDAPLDEVLFMPACHPPHKSVDQLSPFTHRLQMVKLACGNHPRFDVSDAESRFDGPSYTLDVIRMMKSDTVWQDHELILCIGGDSLTELHTWKDPEALLAEIPTLVFHRPDYDVSTADAKFANQVRFVEAPLLQISSSEIRKRVRSGRSIRYYVPDAVLQYIQETGLYRTW